MVDYEIYAQPKNSNVTGIKNKRYHSQDKQRAFAFMSYLNSIEKDNWIWRVAIRVQNKIIFDIDNEDIDNLRLIFENYSFIKGLRIFKSYTGYHIYSMKYDNDWDWHYDCCRVLYPILETQDILKYLGNLHDWYSNEIKKEFELGISREEFIEGINTNFPTSGLYCGIGKFDILFAINVILKGYYCVRISKKAENDKPHEVYI